MFSDMIGLAVLEYVAGKVSGLIVGTNCFYEELPIDSDTGMMSKYGVFVTTEPMGASRTSDRSQRLTFYVAIGEGATVNGVAVAEKYETDRILDAIQSTILEAENNYTDLCELPVSNTELVYKDVRLELDTTKERGGTLTNGAIVKSVVAKVIYKN